MPDDGPDRLGDLGERSRASAAERFAGLDEREPEPLEASQSRDPRPAPARYTWVVGLLAVILVVAAVITTDSNGPDYGVPAGRQMPDFAANSALSGQAGDANVRQPVGGSSEEGPVPACERPAPGMVTNCAQDRPVVLTFVSEGLPSCERQLDRVAAVAPSHPGVDFVGVLFGMEPSESRALARGGGWRFPLASDPDAAIFNLFQLAPDCPSTVFTDAAGEILATRLGPLSEAQLEAEIAMLKTVGRDER